MTTTSTRPSRFKADNTASNMCGFTLMNNQVGTIVADVMSRLDNVQVTYLPSMIRIDAKGRMDVVYSDIDDVKLNKLKTSYGIGFRFNTSKSVFLRFDIGFGHEGPRRFLKFGHVF